MDPSADFLSWLAQQQPTLYGALLFLAFVQRQISVLVGKRPAPVADERLAWVWNLLGFVSGAAWSNCVVSTKAIFGPMPPLRPVPDAVPKAADEAPTKPERGTATPEGGWRSGDTPPQGSGNFPRIAAPSKLPPAGVLIIGFLFAFSAGCALSAIDKARAEFTRTLKAQTAIQSRWKLQNREYQRKNIERIGVHTVGAEAWQKEWIVKKAPVEEQIRRCQSILEEASDFLLLSDDKRGLATVSNAVACVSAEKDMIGKLLDGGL